MTPARVWKQTLQRTRQEIRADKTTFMAAGVAFYWFLAVFPALIAAVGVLDLVDAGPLAIEWIKDAVNAALPGDAAKVLIDAVSDMESAKEGASFLAAAIGIAVAIWSASASMVALQNGLDVAYGVENERRFVKKRTVALELVVVAGFLAGIATASLVFAKPIGEWFDRNIAFDGMALVFVFAVARWLVALFCLTLLVAVFYYIGPNRKSPAWQWVSPGGILATGGWIIASLGFSKYVSYSGSYAKTYGSLAGVVVLVLWMYLSALVLLIGAQLNAELERQNQAQSAASSPGDASAHRSDGNRRTPLGKLAAVALVGAVLIRRGKNS